MDKLIRLVRFLPKINYLNNLKIFFKKNFMMNFNSGIINFNWY